MNNFLIVLFCVLIYGISFISISQDGPKDLINVEEENLPKEENKENLIKETETIKQEDNFPFSQTIEEQDNNIEQQVIIDDIPKEFNNWYGVLSSKDGGLGWLMWGDTEYKLSIDLLRSLPTNVNSYSILNLYSNLLLSRAQSPILLEQEKNDGINIQKFQHEYFDEKIRLMVELGLTKKIRLLEESIPLEIRDFLFKKRLQAIRFESNDIYYICQNIQSRLDDKIDEIFNRKILISCNIAKNKNSEALLALELLENDLEEEDDFLKISRQLIEGKNKIDIIFKNLQKPLGRILSLSDKVNAKKEFIKKEFLLDNLIYKMQLYDAKDQLESLERLVQRGTYEPKLLKQSYINFLNNYDDDYLSNLDTIGKNSIEIRAYLFMKSMIATDEIDKAKSLSLLWKKARETGIEKAISYITSDMISVISLENNLNWFLLPAAKNLLLSNQKEQVKKILFNGQLNLNDRASLDANFCKALLLLYVKDQDLYISNSQNLPDVNFLLEILLNDINTSKEDLEKLALVLKALNFKINDQIWKNFIFEDKTKKKNNDLTSNFQSLFIHLEYAVSKKNKAEVALISAILLSNYFEKNDYSSLFHALNALEKSGLGEFAEEIVIEISTKFF